MSKRKPLPPDALSLKRRRYGASKVVYCCFNPLCNQGFSTQKAFRMHLSKSPICFSKLDKHMAQQPTKTQLQHQNMVSKIEGDGFAEFMAWDNSTDEDNDSLSSTSSVSLPVTPPAVNRLLDPALIATIDTQTTVPLVGIKFTSEQYLETKLLKLLDDVQAPFALFRDIMVWAKEAQHAKYSFDGLDSPDMHM